MCIFNTNRIKENNNQNLKKVKMFYPKYILLFNHIFILFFSFCFCSFFVFTLSPSNKGLTDDNKTSDLAQPVSEPLLEPNQASSSVINCEFFIYE